MQLWHRLAWWQVQLLSRACKHSVWSNNSICLQQAEQALQQVSHNKRHWNWLSWHNKVNRCDLHVLADTKLGCICKHAISQHRHDSAQNSVISSQLLRKVHSCVTHNTILCRTPMEEACRAREMSMDNSSSECTARQHVISNEKTRSCLANGNVLHDCQARTSAQLHQVKRQEDCTLE